MRDSLRRVTGAEVELTGFEIGIRSSDNTRQAETYRRGRILLAGDAAHVHSPIGGQGLNLGVQDAVNLGWKLALVARGLAPESLLDTYTAERHPVAERVLRNTRAQVALMRPGPQVDALREVLTEVVALPEAGGYFTALANGTDTDYAPGAHGATGRFLSSLQLRDNESASGALRDGKGVLFGGPELGTLVAGHRDRVHVVTPTRDTGEPTALLVRPDGYVAWESADHDPVGLTTALTTWFGSPAT